MDDPVRVMVTMVWSKEVARDSETRGNEVEERKQERKRGAIGNLVVIECLCPSSHVFVYKCVCGVSCVSGRLLFILVSVWCVF